MLLRGRDSAGSDLSSAAEEVCSLVQALLLHYNRAALVSATGKQLVLCMLWQGCHHTMIPSCYSP